MVVDELLEDDASTVDAYTAAESTMFEKHKPPMRARTNDILALDSKKRITQNKSTEYLFFKLGELIVIQEESIDHPSLDECLAYGY